MSRCLYCSVRWSAHQRALEAEFGWSRTFVVRHMRKANAKGVSRGSHGFPACRTFAWPAGARAPVRAPACRAGRGTLLQQVKPEVPQGASCLTRIEGVGAREGLVESVPVRRVATALPT